MKKSNNRKKMRSIHMLILLSSIVVITCIEATELHNDHELQYGLYALDIIKMILGIITIIGAFGFFITTSPRKAHWPAHYRRFFFGVFVFCNIIAQTLFNVISLPTNKRLICSLGQCITKFSSKKAPYHD